MAQWAPNVSISTSQTTGDDIKTFIAQNLDTATILAGMPCSIHPIGEGVVRAIATSAESAAVGMASQDIAPGASGVIIVAGVAEVLDWTDVTSEHTPALAPRGIYFLSDRVAGLITTTAPSTVGSVVQVIGRSLNPTSIDLLLPLPILL